MTTKRPNPIFIKQGADVLAEVDERDVKIVGADTKKTFTTALGGYANYTSGNSSGTVTKDEVKTQTDGQSFQSLSSLIPQLGDMSIVSQTINYSTKPPTIDIIMKVKNSTGAIVKGINARVTN